MTLLIGFTGGILVLASFAAIAFGRLRPSDPSYHLMNLAGALALVVSGIAVRAWPSVAVNVVWALISGAGMASSRRGRTRFRRRSTAAA